MGQRQYRYGHRACQWHWEHRRDTNRSHTDYEDHQQNQCQLELLSMPQPEVFHRLIPPRLSNRPLHQQDRRPIQASRHPNDRQHIPIELLFRIQALQE